MSPIPTETALKPSRPGVGAAAAVAPATGLPPAVVVWASAPRVLSPVPKTPVTAAASPPNSTLRREARAVSTTS